jgi:hypothetical protein
MAIWHDRFRRWQFGIIVFKIGFQVAQSLLWLVAYFWHFTRPALAILLDPDLKSDVARFFGASNRDYANIELRGEPGRPLQKPNATALSASPPAPTLTTSTADTTLQSLLSATEEV